MTEQEKAALVDELNEAYSHEVQNPSCPVNQACVVGDRDESSAAVWWVAASVLRWVRTKKGRQFVKVHGVKSWWEPERSGSVLLAVTGDTKCDSYVVELSPHGERGLNLKIFTGSDASLHGTCGTGARLEWSERATVFPTEEGMGIEPVLKSAKLHSGKRR
jgi:hypothetical protein